MVGGNDLNAKASLQPGNLVQLSIKDWSWDRIGNTGEEISVVTIQELEIGALLGERRAAITGAIFRTWLNRYVLPAFEGRILAIVPQNAKLHVPDPHSVVRDGLIVLIFIAMWEWFWLFVESV